MAKFRLYRRGDAGMYYLQDNETGRQESLKTRRAEEARRVLNARNEAAAVPEVTRKIAAAYLWASDPAMKHRTWQVVMDEFSKRGGVSTRERKARAMASKAFDPIRTKKLIETTSGDFLTVLERGTVSTNVFLRKLHNLAFDLDWLPKRILSKKVWPVIRYGKKRAITLNEHSRIIEREGNPERKQFYELLWETGASQGDAAVLTCSNVDWDQRLLIIHRRKLQHLDPVPAQISIGERLEGILCQLPKEGPLFPNLAKVRSGDRATEFKQRCEGLGIKGVTLHSYRYAWAQRAKSCGYPERFAMSNLGHQSKAIHRAYAEHADVIIPSLEEYVNHFRQTVLKVSFQNGKAVAAMGQSAQVGSHVS